MLRNSQLQGGLALAKVVINQRLIPRGVPSSAEIAVPQNIAGCARLRALNDVPSADAIGRVRVGDAMPGGPWIRVPSAATIGRRRTQAGLSADAPPAPSSCGLIHDA